MTPEIVAATSDVLGEAPLHDVADGSFRWVDIGRGLWHRLDLSSGAVRSCLFDVALTGFAPTEAGDFIGAFATGIARFSADGVRGNWLAQPEINLDANRFNDAGTDPAGRFLAGSMNKVDGSPSGALYSYANGEISVLRSGIGIANTVAFSPDGRRLYTADSAKGELAAFAYDPETGQLGERIAEFQPDPGLPGVPDGSAVDVEGCIWNARWGGGCVVRLSPAGATLAIVELPVQLPTSCCFVGSSLYITTSTWDFSDTDRERQPLAGSVLCVATVVAGCPKPSFRSLHL